MSAIYKRKQITPKGYAFYIESTIMSKIATRGMHERNIFKVPPDYTELAIKYADFRHVCTLELCGKVSIDYKNEYALRTLTKTLLTEYFQLNVEFAPGSLIPTLPLRLNYVLWLEDLLMLLPKNEQIHGIDIGCGSSCIYSLLAARKNAWQMLALESNETNVHFAQQNVERNKLQDLITVFQQDDKNVIFKQLFENLSTTKHARNFEFCICNPPFYDTKQPNSFEAKSRNPSKRSLPHNCHTGRDEELACDGGEVRFVQNIIAESLHFKSNVSIFTTMLGHKSSLGIIKETLNAENIFNYCCTEFCQGKTTRWGIAWSFKQNVNLTEFQNK